MSGVIDKIYKDLTKSQNQVGGTAWFTLEEAEVSLVSLEFPCLKTRLRSNMLRFVTM